MQCDSAHWLNYSRWDLSVGWKLEKVQSCLKMHQTCCWINWLSTSFSVSLRGGTNLGEGEDVGEKQERWKKKSSISQMRLKRLFETEHDDEFQTHLIVKITEIVWIKSTHWKCDRVSVCVCVSLLISVFAKWTKWEPTGSCALHFFLLFSSSSPEPRCTYVSGCFNFSAHNWAEPQGAPHPLGRHSKHKFTPSHSLSPWVGELLLLSYSPHTNTHRQAESTVQRADQTNKLQTKTTRKKKGSFALTLYFQRWTKKHKLLGAPLPLRQWQRKINK